ncbi:MAG: GNAT family acetyltransferase [Proteobacteria bacterium]|nr:GNAT family acetyltransferase [Pseudomonadota bacterium]
MLIRPFLDSDTDAVIALWQRCGLTRAWNDPAKDIARKKTVQPELFLLGLVDGTVIASAMAGYDGHRAWVNYLAVDPDAQQKGYGRALMAAVELQLRALGAPKINLQIRRDNAAAIAFYARIGFTEDAVVSLGKRLQKD